MQARDFARQLRQQMTEADGGQHNENPKDTQRDTWLTTQGYQVLRFWNHDILTQTESAMTAIFLAMEERRALCPLPRPSRPPRKK